MSKLSDFYDGPAAIVCKECGELLNKDDGIVIQQYDGSLDITIYVCENGHRSEVNNVGSRGGKER